MSSNVTLRSNVYINLTARTDDKDFIQHITDYRVLRKLRGGPYDFSPYTQLMTDGQKAILRQGQPNCSLEKGTMSWGIPVGADKPPSQQRLRFNGVRNIDAPPKRRKRLRFRQIRTTQPLLHLQRDALAQNGGTKIGNVVEVLSCHLPVSLAVQYTKGIGQHIVYVVYRDHLIASFSRLIQSMAFVRSSYQYSFRSGANS